MRVRALIVGIAGGLLIGGVIGVLVGSLHRREPRAEPLGEDGGRITRVVMQYQPEAGPLVAPIYRQFLSAISRDVQVVWVVGKSSDLDDLKIRLGRCWPDGRCRAVVVGKDISTWAKDRFVAMRTSGSPAMAVLCAPARRRTANPLRTNDQEVPYRLAQDPSHLFSACDTEADFDGGDFLATSRHLFAGPAIIEKNNPGAGERFRSVDELTDHLNRKLSSRIIWLGTNPAESPPHHIGMFLTVIGQIAAVGDVRLAEKMACLPETHTALQRAGGIASPAFRSDLSTRLDHIARQMQSLDYKVVRVPLLPSATPRAWMSYNNGIVETRNGETIFYMPTFGATALDAAAATSFRAATGCRVVPIDCSRIWHLGGSLHCLVNVVGRE